MGAFGAADFLVTSRRAPKRIVVDRLLLHWTTLEPSEIRTTRISNTASSPWETHLTRHANFVELDEEEDEEGDEEEDDGELVVTPEGHASQPGIHLPHGAVSENESSDGQDSAGKVDSSEDELITSSPIFERRYRSATRENLNRDRQPLDLRMSSGSEDKTNHRTYVNNHDRESVTERNRDRGVWESVDLSSTRCRDKRREKRRSSDHNTLQKANEPQHKAAQRTVAEDNVEG